MNNEYKHIQTKEEYQSLKASGMFWEFHPELSGNWEQDKVIIRGIDYNKENIPSCINCNTELKTCDETNFKFCPNIKCDILYVDD